jgi:hypothetical protein
VCNGESAIDADELTSEQKLAGLRALGMIDIEIRDTVQRIIDNSNSDSVREAARRVLRLAHR